MQLGARWRVGDTPHRGVPPTLHETVTRCEAEFTGAHSWTLTWLEGRPVLQLDDRCEVRVGSQGEVRVVALVQYNTSVDRGDAVGQQSGSLDGGEAGDDADEEEDDWLR